MAVKCIDVINIMEKYANSNMAESWDNVGLIVGDEQSNIERILVALDINDEVIDEAIEKKADLIITHHPFIFKPIKKINTSDNTGRKIIKLIKNNINVYTAHTNLDIATNGTNDTFVKLLNLKNIKHMFKAENSENGIGRFGELEKEILFSELAEKVKNITNLEKIVISGDLDKKIKKVGVCTGSGGEASFIVEAKKNGCDAYITGDIKYHNAQIANELGMAVIDATHYATEVLIIPVICDYINRCASKLNIIVECIPSNVDGQTFKIV